MVRGFVSGLVWGGVVASAGLAVISQIAPLPPTSANAPVSEPTAAPAPDATPAPEAPAAAPDVPDAPAAEAEAGTPATQPDAEAPAPAPVAGETGTPETAATEPAATVRPEAQDAPAQAPASVDPTAPDAPKAPAAPGLPPASVAGSDAAPEAPPAPSASDPLTADPVPPQADLPPPPPRPPLDEALLAPPPAPPVPERAPLPQVGMAPAAPEPAAPEAPAPEAPAPETPAPEAPALPGKEADPLPAPDPSVATDRLPRIGAAEPLPEVEVIPDEAAPARPIEAFARPFENPEAKPLFAILLVDDGAPGLDRAALAKLPFPVTFVLDPLAPGAAEAAAIYRAEMQEVVFAAAGLPPGATAADVEQTFQSHALALPEAVAVVDLPEGGFQDDRALAAAVLPILAEQGRGLLTHDRGLNAADQIARREGLPAATIFRRLDAAGESIPTMRRYLDRAAFRAAQEGEVVVIGTTAAETVAALLEWTVEGRAASVALAPVSAVLTRP